MKCPFGCGVIFGILIGLVLCGIVFFVIYCWRNPAEAEKQVGVAESTWNQVKSGGDRGFEFIRSALPKGKTAPAAAPAAAPETETIPSGAANSVREKSN